ncbi:MAG: acyl carrier protein [Lachnospiraceae bacterium]|nr:acyl carrier protein [Lachnospiraceae bacterium]
MDKEQIKGKLLEVVEDVIPELEQKDIQMDASLTDDYNVNSVSMIRMLEELEDKFGVQYEDNELAIYKYATFDDVVDSLEKKLK